VMTKSKEDLM